MFSPEEMTPSGVERKNDPCVQITYETFVEGIRAIAPPLAELQPHWERMPAPVKEAWRKAFAAGLDRYLKLKLEGRV